MTIRLAEGLRALREEKITFRQFYARTREEWHRMAVVLHRHWKLPPTVTVDDVEQELLLHAWVFVPQWDPEKGSSLAGYVVWNAHDKTLKWIHKQRSCNQHTRKGRSEFAYCISMLAREGEEGSSLLERHADGSPDSEQTLDYGNLLDALPGAAGTEAGKVALERFIAAAGDVEEAARSFHADSEHRYLFRLRSRKHAAEIITREVRGVRRMLLSEERGG